jgi:predicted DNA-binding antitoxin AbrB/MazE fold protein
MKKIFIALIVFVLLSALFVFAPGTSATDVCSNEPHSSADFYVETSRASWLMSMSCVDSDLVVTMPQGSVMHVIGKTEGWHKLVTKDGHEGWMWEDFVTSTSKEFNPYVKEPEPYENEPSLYPHDPMFDIDGHKYEEAIWDMYYRGVIQGYPDGSYKPYATINRAELVKVVVEINHDDTYNDFDNVGCFTDIKKEQWYAKYICYAESKGIVEGYPDGSFKPEQEVNFVEGLKIVIRNLHGGNYEETTPWYKNYVDIASASNLIPLDIDKFDEKLTRGQVAETLYREIKDRDNETEAYVQEKGGYTVTYETIEAGILVEDLVGTGSCIFTDMVIENGNNYEYCACGDGTIYCTEATYGEFEDLYLNWDEGGFLYDFEEKMSAYSNGIFGIYTSYNNFTEEDFVETTVDAEIIFDHEECSAINGHVFDNALFNTFELQALDLQLSENVEITLFITKNIANWNLELAQDYANCSTLPATPVQIIDLETSIGLFDAILWSTTCNAENQECIDAYDALVEQIYINVAVE